jgi:hypothetical protein
MDQYKKIKFSSQLINLLIKPTIYPFSVKKEKVEFLFLKLRKSQLGRGIYVAIAHFFLAPLPCAFYVPFSTQSSPIATQIHRCDVIFKTLCYLGLILVVLLLNLHNK